MTAQRGIFAGDLSGQIVAGIDPWSAGEPSLAAAALVLLGTDRRADASELRGSDTDPRGWWGDDHGGRQGSRLWLCQAMPATAETARLAETYAAEALQPLITAGVVASVTVSARYTTAGLELRIDARRSNGSTVSAQYDDLWAAIASGGD